MDVDFGKTASDYGAYRAGFPDALFDRLSARGLPFAGQTVLDLATGTGTLARGFARRGATVTGLDIATAMLAEARRLAKAEGVAIDFVEGKAEATGLAGGAFDIVAAGQCWHWFDGVAAAREAWRLLRPGGHLLIAHFDWLPLPGNQVEATERLIETHNPAWRFGGGNGIHAHVLTDAAIAGFTALESFSFDHPAPYSHEAWRGRIRASAGVGGSLAPAQVRAFDRAHAAMLAERFPDDPMEVPHRVFAMIGSKP